MKCRHCSSELNATFLDLGFAPPSNAYLNQQDLSRPEVYLPLRVMVCEDCWLVQTEDYSDANDLFTPDYAYFSSTSSGFLRHAAEYVDKIRDKLALDSSSFVVEVASNDGYLLKNFVAAGVPCLGIEPTASTADAAEKIGVPVLREFFGEASARRLVENAGLADLIIGNNVYAHVPDINDFTRGLKALLKPEGVVTLEFPHFLRLLEGVQFDTVYHEHFSYLSLHTVTKIFDAAGLRIWDVEELDTHGGSLRIYGCHKSSDRQRSSRVDDQIIKEERSGLQTISTYEAFQGKVDNIKNALLSFLLEQKASSKTVMAYGAAAKGNTLLNYCGVKSDLLPLVVDAAEAKQGKYLPGSHIPILSPVNFNFDSVDFLLILPWNIADEVKCQLNESGFHNISFVTAIPRIKIG